MHPKPRRTNISALRRTATVPPSSSLPPSAMAAISPHITTAFQFLPALRSSPCRLSPAAFAASAVPLRGARVVARGSRHPGPLARNSLWFERATSFSTERLKKPLFASETDSPSTGSPKQSSTDGSSPPNGPPVLTILAGIIVLFLVFWVIGSIFTSIVGLFFGAAKS